MIVISDNSALSCLAEMGELTLLQRMYGAVSITATVQQEASRASAPAVLRNFVASPPSWFSVVDDIRPYLEETAMLDDGEASSITVAWHHRASSLLIMDEKRGRRVSAALGLRFTGVAGLLTDAAVAGLVAFEDAFRRLALTGFRLDDSVVEQLRQRYHSRVSAPPA